MSESAIERVVKRMDAIADRKEKELNELCKNPDVFKIIQVFADNFIANLNYLCNFKSITDGNGKKCDILEVIQRLQEDTIKDVKRLTGQEYEVPTCRDFQAIETERTNGSSESQ